MVCESAQLVYAADTKWPKWRLMWLIFLEFSNEIDDINLTQICEAVENEEHTLFPSLVL